ncbi:MAG: AI-2E family transporter [Acidobacteria bacterium]|nr:AI-2E family transporter [Acidobacteriota bacterium]
MQRSLILKLEKWAMWGSLIGILYILRHLFPLFFLTFVLSYICNSSIKALEPRLPSRRTRVVVVFTLLLLILTGVAVLVVPRLITEAASLARQIITSEAEQGDIAQGEPTEEERPQARSVVTQELLKVLDDGLVRLVGIDTHESFRHTELYDAIVENIDSTIGSLGPSIRLGLQKFVNGAFNVGTQFIVAVIISLLVLWDLPSIGTRLSRFREGRTAEIYAEIAPGARAFGVVMGRAFEAQTVIALVNTILSCIGFWILGLPAIALLGAIVFFCSYIPIFGMILSTMPAALLAFRTQGIGAVAWVIVIVAIIHAIEAYGINPLIYGKHLKMHPIMIILVLLIGEHVFGLWGLLLGVPVSAFIIKYVVEGNEWEETAIEEASAEA